MRRISPRVVSRAEDIEIREGRGAVYFRRKRRVQVFEKADAEGPAAPAKSEKRSWKGLYQK